MRAPNYTLGDLLFYVGVFAGLIVMHFVLMPWGVHPIIRLIIGGLFGAGIGWCLEQMYRRVQRPQPAKEEKPEPEDEDLDPPSEHIRPRSPRDW